MGLHEKETNSRKLLIFLTILMITRKMISGAIPATDACLDTIGLVAEGKSITLLPT